MTAMHAAVNLLAPILDRPAEDHDSERFPVTAVRALAPRFGGMSLFYLAAGGNGNGLWRFVAGQASEIWRGIDGTLSEPPALVTIVTRDARVRDNARALGYAVE